MVTAWVEPLLLLCANNPLLPSKARRVNALLDGSTQRCELTECIEVFVIIDIDPFVLVHRAVRSPIAELVRCRFTRMTTLILHGDVRRRRGGSVTDTHLYRMGAVQQVD